MGVANIFNRFFGGQKEIRPNYAALSFMPAVREAASKKTSDEMPIEERLSHIRAEASFIERNAQNFRQP